MCSTEKFVVLSRVANKFPLEEGDVEDGRVVVDELEEVDLEGEAVVELGLGAVQLQVSQPNSHVAVDLFINRIDLVVSKLRELILIGYCFGVNHSNLVEYEDADQVDAGAGG